MLSKLSIAVFILTGFLVTEVFAGNFVGNGGDSTALEFTWLARTGLKRLTNGSPMSKEKLTSTQMMQLKAIAKAVEKIRVVSRDSVMLDGDQVDAVNYPSKKLIVVRRYGWAEMKRLNPLKVRLGFVFHEYLLAAGIAEDTRFEVSQALVEGLTAGQSADTGYEEWFLDSLFELKQNLVQYYNLAKNPAIRPQAVCFIAGSLSSYSRSFLMMASKLSSGVVLGHPQAQIDQLQRVSQTVTRSCKSDRFALPDFRSQLALAISAIDAFTGPILPQLKLDQ